MTWDTWKKKDLDCIFFLGGDGGSDMRIPVSNTMLFDFSDAAVGRISC